MIPSSLFEQDLSPPVAGGGGGGDPIRTPHWVKRRMTKDEERTATAKFGVHSALSLVQLSEEEGG